MIILREGWMPSHQEKNLLECSLSRKKVVSLVSTKDRCFGRGEAGPGGEESVQIVFLSPVGWRWMIVRDQVWGLMFCVALFCKNREPGGCVGSFRRLACRWHAACLLLFTTYVHLEPGQVAQEIF